MNEATPHATNSSTTTTTTTATPLSLSLSRLRALLFLSVQVACDAHLHAAAVAHIAELVQSAAALAALGLVSPEGIVIGAPDPTVQAIFLGVDYRVCFAHSLRHCPSSLLPDDVPGH